MALMMGIAVVKALAGISAAKDGEIAATTQNNIAKQQLKFNNEMRAIQQKEVLHAGDEQAANINQATRGLIGQQKVGYAGQGVDVNSETAKLLQEQAREDAQEDAKTSRLNAAKKAWGLEVESSDATAQMRADNKARSAKASAANMSAGISGLAGVVTAGISMAGSEEAAESAMSNAFDDWFR